MRTFVIIERSCSMLMKTFYTTVFSVFIFSLSYGQDSFERLYRSPGDGHIATAMDAQGEGYVVLSGQPNEEGSYDLVNVTTFNVKGNIGWSQQYMFDDTLKVIDLGDIISLASGNILFSVILDKDSLNKAITLVDGGGNFIWSMLTGKTTDLKRENEESSEFLELPSMKMIHTHRVMGANGSPVVLMTAFNEDKSIINERELSISADISGQVEDMILGADSTVLVLGSTSHDTLPIVLTRMDTFGSVIWSRSYDILVDQREDLRGLHLTELANSNIVIVGGLASSERESRSGFVITTDRNGIALKTEMISSNATNREMYPSGLVTVEDTLVVMAIKLSNGSDVITALMKYNLDSVISYESLLDTTLATMIYSGDLVTVDSQSVTFLSTSQYAEFDNTAPYLAKAGRAGDTPCYEPTMIFTFDSVGVSQDTFAWQFTDIVNDDSIKVEVMSYGAFDPPLLQLPDTVYCPNDPISFRSEATVRGATSYLWDDGSTDSIRIFMEEGEFICTVTIGIEECFVLCDTTTITVMDEPMLSIAKTSQYCENGMILLAAQASGMIVSYQWSNGSTDRTILVDQAGSYSLVIEDVCGIVLDTDASVTDSDLSGSTPLNISVAGPDLCSEGALLLTATGTQDVGNLSWSTGSNAVQSISVNSPGTYTVNYNAEFCPGESSIELTEADFDTAPSGEIEGICNSSQTSYVLTVTGNNIINREWSTGSNSTSIAVTEAGDYSVTLTGPCGDEVDVQISVSEEDISNCIIIETETCLIFPNVFIPRDREDINKTFGPKIDCPVSNYELNIYNRWGEKIWNTTDVNTKWDGLLDGDSAPGGVYFWWARYGEESNPIVVEGDVTLLR
ncbi:MAG: hypothetical protein ACI9FN_000144 [Saprospiraceae bacterium]|jgi:hypothetical protein